MKATCRLIVVALVSLAGAAATTESTGMSGNGPMRGVMAVAEHTGTVSANIDEVWTAFTTAEGLSGFYAPGAFIEPRVGGRFELYLFPENPVGQRGLEGLQILAFEPPRRLMTTWKAPAFVRARLGSQYTIQEISLMRGGPEETMVSLRQFGFGDAPEWEKAKWYFELRQRDVFLNLTESLDSDTGSVDWDAAMARFRATSEQISRCLEAC